MKRFNLLPMRNRQYKNVANFQRNVRGGHLVFKNEANFSPREAYPPMKISCKFGEPSWCSFPLRALTPKISLKMASLRYFGGLWMTFNEEPQGQISACLQRTDICIIYTSHRTI